ncbi:MAG: hypothetical protein M2R45_02264 [Verrucomicrobia subdivision 3 bacterium]|nr:hypothetical protein [Limisphaerales bacterium]MCS1413950.1 hypothetical protein [Limisphaerales bacterium]
MDRQFGIRTPCPVEKTRACPLLAKFKAPIQLENDTIQPCSVSASLGTGISKTGQVLGVQSCPEVFQAATDGHPEATQVIKRAKHSVAITTPTIARTFCPERIILGSGLTDAYYDTFATVMRDTLSHAKQLPKDQIQIASPTRESLRAGWPSSSDSTFRELGLNYWYLRGIQGNVDVMKDTKWPSKALQ